MMADLRVENLSFRNRGPYSFIVHGGQCCGLCGASGSGKTLLLRSLVDLDQHTGMISLDTVTCREIQAPEWRKRVGMLPAESCWWFDSVGEHFSDPGSQVKELLRPLGFGMDVMDWQVQRLSTGEKQRLAIVRLLANSPQALLLDEPTASLDRKNITRAEDMLLGYCRDKAIPLLWVSHDPVQLDRVADLCMTMQQDGRLVEGKM